VQLSRKSPPEVDAATVTSAIENALSKIAPVPGREGRGMTLAIGGGQMDGRVVLRSFKGRITLRGT
jgi:hypothetical protein